jgi:hypothetical protein
MPEPLREEATVVVEATEAPIAAEAPAVNEVADKKKKARKTKDSAEPKPTANATAPIAKEQAPKEATPKKETPKPAIVQAEAPKEAPAAIEAPVANETPAANETAVVTERPPVNERRPINERAGSSGYFHKSLTLNQTCPTKDQTRCWQHPLPTAHQLLVVVLKALEQSLLLLLGVAIKTSILDGTGYALVKYLVLGLCALL